MSEWARGRHGPASTGRWAEGVMGGRFWAWFRSKPWWGQIGLVVLAGFATLVGLGLAFGSSSGGETAGASAPSTHKIASVTTEESTSTASTEEPPAGPTVRASATGVFYPLEQDGQKDSARYSFRTDVTSVVTIRVENTAGRVVRLVSLGRLAGHRRHTWKWDGRSGSDQLVRAGQYLIVLSADRKSTRLNSSHP